MGMENIIKIAAGLALMAATTGHLREITREVQIAQIHILKQSKASSWGTPMLIFPAVQNRTLQNP